MLEELQPNKSTRSFEEWKTGLIKIIANSGNTTVTSDHINDERIRPYYDQGLMPDVCFKELFNR